MKRCAARGQNNGSAELTEVQVVDIRRRAAAGEQYASLALEYDTSPGNIGSIVSRRTWKHVQ